MRQGGAVSIPVGRHNLIATYIQETLRITIQTDQAVYLSPSYSPQNLPSPLVTIFQSPNGLYQWLMKQAHESKKISLRDSTLYLIVSINDRTKQLPLHLRKMKQQKPSTRGSTRGFMLTSIASQPSESRVSLKSEQISKVPAPRLQLMVLKQQNKAKKALSRMPILADSKTIPRKARSIHRYSQQPPPPPPPRRYSLSVNKAQKVSRVKGGIKSFVGEGSLDLSNKELGAPEVVQLVGLDVSRLTVLNLGYNNICNLGLSTLFTVQWPALHTLYVCFDNISEVEWTPTQMPLLQTLSLSGNRIRQIPPSIADFASLRQLFAYNNRLQDLPVELLYLNDLKNFSVYGNRLDPKRTKKIVAKLKSRKVQVWE